VEAKGKAHRQAANARLKPYSSVFQWN